MIELTSEFQGKGKTRNQDQDNGGSVDLMELDVDIGGSGLEQPSLDPPSTKKTNARGKKATSPTKKASAKAPAKGRGKKAAVSALCFNV